MSGVPYSARAVTERLRAAARLSDLRRGPESKVDMSASAVTRRLRQQAALRASCLAWGRLLPRDSGGDGTPPPRPAS